MRDAVRSAWESVSDALWPRRCVVCDAGAADGVACGAHALPRRPRGPRCGRCAARLPAALPDGVTCGACRRDSPAFAGVTALADYREDAGARACVGLLKYGGRRDLAAWLGAALAEACPDGLVVPVPLHPVRRLERGYDQAALLARALAARTGADVLPALARTRPTPPQGAPGARSRRANVRGAFVVRAAARGRLGGADVWLVDDVVTSGATADACARVLRRAGAARVRVACVARAGAGGAGALPSGP